MRGDDHESQVEIAVGYDEIIKEEVTEGVEQDVGHTPADRVTEHLPGQDRGDGPDVKPVDRPGYQLRKGHQRAV